MLPPAGEAWPTVFAASSARLSASGVDTSGLRRALAHGDADAGAREIDAAAGDLALLDELVERRRVGQEHVDGFAAVEAGDQRAGGRIARANAVAVGAFERRQQFVGRRFDRGRDERVDFGGCELRRSRSAALQGRRWRAWRSSLAGFHAFRLHHRGGFRRGQELDQRFGAIRVLGRRSTPLRRIPSSTARRPAAGRRCRCRAPPSARAIAGCRSRPPCGRGNCRSARPDRPGRRPIWSSSPR